MPNRLEAALTQHRARVRSIDRASLAALYEAYQGVMDRLDPLIELLQQEANDDGAQTPSEVFLLDRWQLLRDQLDAEMRRLADQTGAVTTDAQRKAVSEAVSASERLAVASAAGQRATASVAASWTRLPVWALEDLIGATANGPLADLLASFGDTAQRAVVDELVTGLALGKGPRTVADAIHRGTDIARNRALLISRTEMVRSLRSATARQYQSSRDVVSGWVWVSAKQARSCAACIAMDGTIHDLDEPMQSHPACRCGMRPYLRDVPMRDVESGAQWFDRQPADVQDQVLGKAGGAAYRAGDVQLMDFVRIDESPEWGRSVRDGGIAWARMRAEQGRRLAA